ncbi:MAG: ribonuclease HII [bacterium]|nr:ribonuclease HII [bacterium]
MECRTVRLTLRELRESVAAGPPYDPGLLASLQNDSRAGARALYESCLRRTQRAQAAADRTAAMMRFEDEARANGFDRIAGVDEAGRGPLAGPIVAAAVVLLHPVPGVDDSKVLSAEQRERLFVQLHQENHAIGKAIIAPEEVDHRGIQSANLGAMTKAVRQIEPAPDFLLVDGFAIPGCSIPHKRLVKGDRRSQSIAAASIVAKVVRDRIMCELDKQFPDYGFARHKGYGTEEHLDAIARFGPCPAHRMSFAPLSRPTKTGELFQPAGERPCECE